ncbi:MAG: glycosyltransferase [Pseudomonadota bacterium]|nr:glycosyltransferase [Pseudomonadota bacterium]
MVREIDGFSTLDLWAIDLVAQLKVTSELQLVCPLVATPPSGWQGRGSLPDAIRVLDSTSLRPPELDRLIRDCDVVQVYGGQGWHASRLCRQVVSAARRVGRKTVVGLSSNRARSALLNEAPHGARDLPRAARALLAYVGLRANYWWLTSRADGTFIVGEGLRRLVAKSCPSLHVGIASWLQASDIAAARERLNAERGMTPSVARLSRWCIASRLEPMKGIHVGIDALARLRAAGRADGLTLTIYGAGPERARLDEQVARSGLGEQVVFAGTLTYPLPFLDRLQEHGIVVLPNLNDEQPRILFDAISCGCLPVCPDTPAYRALGLPAALLYEVGDSRSMAAALDALRQNSAALAELHKTLYDIAERHTLESMHAKRAAWINHEILKARPAGT